MPEKILFLTLRTFSATGGIEKVSRQMGKALHELSGYANDLDIFSMYDSSAEIDERYFPAAAFRGFAENKLTFMWAAFFAGIKKEKVIISHINLLLPAFLIKIFSKKTKLLVLAHGIEVWDTLPPLKRWMLAKCDKILPVSNFTKNKMMASQNLPESKFTILNNCLDPFLQAPSFNGKNQALLNRYGLKPEHIIIMTLTRLSSKEKYKGYDNVLFSIPALKLKYPGIKYLVVGKYDEQEKARLIKIARELNLLDDLIIAGFIPDTEIAAHFETSDVYVMPSKKEGFGLVFIEAMFYGKPVVAGNQDGSADALGNGKFGLLVNPDSKEEIAKAIASILGNTVRYLPENKQVLEKFSFTTYKQKLQNILSVL